MISGGKGIRRKRIKAIFTVAVLTLALCGCEESAEKKYSSAQSLINKGKYSKAVEKLRDIGTYKDSVKLLQYANANIAAESGNYSDARITLQALGSFMDSEQLDAYYRAKEMAEEDEECYIRDVIET